MMTCGHSPNGKDMETGRPVCVICNCETVGENPDLLTRVAQCGICGEKQESKLDPYFSTPFDEDEEEQGDLPIIPKIRGGQQPTP